MPGRVSDQVDYSTRDFAIGTQQDNLIPERLPRTHLESEQKKTTSIVIHRVFVVHIVEQT